MFDLMNQLKAKSLIRILAFVTRKHILNRGLCQSIESVLYDHFIINTKRHYPVLGTLPALCTFLTFYMLAVWSPPKLNWIQVNNRKLRNKRRAARLTVPPHYKSDIPKVTGHVRICTCNTKVFVADIDVAFAAAYCDHSDNIIIVCNFQMTALCDCFCGQTSGDGRQSY